MRALLSVYDKSELDTFASGLIALGWELISTGGTLKFLQDHQLPVTAVDDITGFPEIMDGRVKTLHPAVHGGILARRDRADDLETLSAHGIGPIDLVAVNLYPFESTIRRGDCTLPLALENIDIGGPTMIRAAAKNFPDVLVLCDPDSYADVLLGLQSGTVSSQTRRALAARAFAHVATYDALVADYLNEAQPFPNRLPIAARKELDLRYGENPHQTAAAYGRINAGPLVRGVLDSTQLQGKELSYNNILDADAALSLCRRFAEPACVIVKHAIPCGAAQRANPTDAFRAALAGDPVSAFGGIVAVNRPVDGELAAAIGEIFFEVIIAPGFSEEARTILRRKKSLRLQELPAEFWPATGYQSIRSIAGGLLVQDADVAPDDPDEWTLATESAPTKEQRLDLAFAWEVVRSVRSNAIVLVKDLAVVGVGPGQPNRVDCVRIAIERAGDRATGSVLASDAYFPFKDGVETAIGGGIAAIVQPGGSVRDGEAIETCNAAGVPMLFTGKRHFLH